MRRLLWIFSLITFFVIMNCGKPDMSYVAKVGDKVFVDKEDVLKQFRFRKQEKDKDEMTLSDLEDFIETNMGEGLLFQAEGFRLGIDKEPEFQKKIHETTKKTITGRDGPLYEHVVSQKTNVSDKEIQELYDKQGEEIKIAQILVHTQSLADSLYGALQKGADFAELAEKFSGDERSKNAGGEMRLYFSRGDMPEDVENVAFALKVGEISKPVKSRLGIHIFKLLERREKEKQPLDKMKLKLHNQIRHNKLSRIVESYVENLYKKYELQVDPTAAAIMIKAKTQTQNGKQETLRPGLLSQDEVNQILVRYKGGLMTVRDGINAYLSDPWARKIPLNHPSDVEDFFKKSLLTEFMWFDAKELGFDKDPKVQKNVQQAIAKLVGRECKQRLIYRTVDVTDDEVRAKYEMETDKYNGKSFEDVQRRIRNELKVLKNKTTTENVVKELKSRHKIAFNKPALEELLPELNELKKKAAQNQAVAPLTQRSTSPTPMQQPPAKISAKPNSGDK